MGRTLPLYPQRSLPSISSSTGGRSPSSSPLPPSVPLQPHVCYVPPRYFWKSLQSSNISNPAQPRAQTPSHMSSYAMEAPSLTRSLHLLLADIWSAEYIPLHWRAGIIHPLPKPSTKSAFDKAGFRPITLVSCVGKVLEQLLLNRIKPVLDPLLSESQAGFRPGRRPAHQLFILSETIFFYRSHRRRLYVAFLDNKAAYDSVLA